MLDAALKRRSTITAAEIKGLYGAAEAAPLRSRGSSICGSVEAAP